jgi:hypothetical protein
MIVFLVGLGPAHRTDLDFESDTTLLRAFQGAPAAFFFKDWSSVPEISFTYGGWPPLHTLIQASFVLMGLSIPVARLATGAFSIFAFAVAMTWLVRRLLPSSERSLVFAVSLLCPITLAYVQSGVATILVPAAAATSFLFLTAKNETRSWTWNVLALFVGFILGAVDWHVYGLVPVLFGLYLFDRYRRSRGSGALVSEQFYLVAVFLSLGMIAFFIVYKSALVWHLAHCVNCYVTYESVTLAKLLFKMSASPKTLALDGFFTTVRIGWTVLILAPTVLILWAVGGAKWIGNSTAYHVFLGLAAAMALVFAAVFPGQTSPSAHGFEILVFVMPACLATAAFIPLRRKHIVQVTIIAYLTLTSILIVSLQSLLPSSLLRFARLVQVRPPLMPGNYNLELPQQLDRDAVLRAIVHQLCAIPDSDPFTTELLRRNKTFLQEHVAQSSILTFFGSPKATFNLSYEINRAVFVVNFLDDLRLLVAKSHHKVLILLPKTASLESANQALTPASLILKGPLVGNAELNVATVQVVDWPPRAPMPQEKISSPGVQAAPRLNDH